MPPIIRRPPKRVRSPIKANKHFNKEIKKSLVKSKKVRKNELYIKAMRRSDRLKTWPIDRNLTNYNNYFQKALRKQKLGNNIVDYLGRRHKTTRQSVSVLDLGAGEGHFLGDLKKTLNNNKIPSKVEALSLHNNLTPENQKLIDKTHILDAGKQVLTKKYDLITDMYSAITYSLEPVKKSLTLKYAYSLKKGGSLLLAGFYGSVNKKKSIIKHLDKQGFNAAFVDNVEDPMTRDKKTVFIITRR